MSLSPSVNRIETHSANCWFAAAISRASEAFNFGFNSKPRLSWQGKSERWRVWTLAVAGATLALGVFMADVARRGRRSIGRA